MSPRKFIWAATVVALLMVALSFLGAATPLAGIQQATRATARFSGLVFAIALIARSGVPRVLGHSKLAWFMAFVGAQGVHFAVIITRAFMEPGNDLRSVTSKSVATVIVGFGFVLLAAFTARAATVTGRRVHSFATYALWGLFVLFFFLHSSGRIGPGEPGAAAMLFVMFTALVWRMMGSLMVSREQAAAVSSGV
jgi:uncharacterized membrane protein YhaH (DUF805 family)